MHRSMLAALCAATLVLPVSAAAQGPGDDEVATTGGLRVSPFVGFLTSFARAEEWVFEEGDTGAFVESDGEIAGGTAFGVQFEAPLQGRIGWQGAAGYATRGD